MCFEKKQMAFYGNMTVAELAETILSEQREGVEAVGRAVPLTTAHIVEIVRHINGASNPGEILNAIVGSRAVQGQAQRCLGWTGRFTKSDAKKGVRYPVLYIHGVGDVLVHRVLYHNFVQAVPLYERKNPNTLLCRHIHANCHCFSPNHLKLGTPADNYKDAVAHGTARITNYDGENNPCARLSWEDVAVIRTMRPAYTYQAIGDTFGVSKATAHHICSGKRWASTPSATPSDDGGHAVGNADSVALLRRQARTDAVSLRRVPVDSAEEMTRWIEANVVKRKSKAGSAKLPRRNVANATSVDGLGP